MKFEPLNNNVIVTIESDKATENSLFVSQSGMGEVVLGKVESSNCEQIKCGEKVVFFKFSACPYTFEGKKYHILNADDCVAVIRGTEND